MENNGGNQESISTVQSQIDLVDSDDDVLSEDSNGGDSIDTSVEDPQKEEEDEKNNKDKPSPEKKSDEKPESEPEQEPEKEEPLSEVDKLKKRVELLQSKVDSYNRSTAIMRNRAEFAYSFHKSMVTIINNDHVVNTNAFIGFYNTIPRTILEMAFVEIDVGDKDNDCEKIIDGNIVKYILLGDSTHNEGEALMSIGKTIMSMMNCAKEKINTDDPASFGKYVVKSVVYRDDGSAHNIRYKLLLVNDDKENGGKFKDSIIVDFATSNKDVEGDGVSVACMTMNDEGILVRDGKFNKTFQIESNFGSTLANLHKDGYGLKGMIGITNEIIHRTPVVIDRKSILKSMRDLKEKTLNRNRKVKRFLNILDFYRCDLPFINSLYLKNTNLKGFPAFYVEKEEDCVYTAISPPYIKIKLSCSHHASIQSLYGLLVDGANEDSEAICCQMCNEKLLFEEITEENKGNKLASHYIEIPSGNEEESEIFYENSRSGMSLNPESTHYINEMMMKRMKRMNSSGYESDYSDSDSDDDTMSM